MSTAPPPPCSLPDEETWSRLIRAIGSKRVIPVVGRGVIASDDLFGGELMSYLGKQLVSRLGVDPQGLEENPNVSQVATRYLYDGGQRRNLYEEIGYLIDDELDAGRIEPPPTLIKLAEIAQFPLFLTTSFDPLLEVALNQVRFGGTPRTQKLEFKPTSVPDLPGPLDSLEATVAYLFGRYSLQPDYAVWDEDAIEFVLTTHRHLDPTSNLGTALNDCDLLLLGVSFTDWLTRFFIRIARQDRLSTAERIGRHYITDPEEHHQREHGSLVVYFDSIEKGRTSLHGCDPIGFVDELHRRVSDAYGTSDFAADQHRWSFPGYSPPADWIAEGDIFLSYSHRDFTAASRIKTELEAAGCTVWFDQERLQAGEDWELTLEKSILKECSVFISLISSNTERPCYCQKERMWAQDRMGFFGSQRFYLPIIIEEGLRSSQLTFERMTQEISRNVVTLVDGETTPKFCDDVAHLQQHNRSLLKK